MKFFTIMFIEVALIHYIPFLSCYLTPAINADAIKGKKWNENLHHSSVALQHVPGSTHVPRMC